MISRKHYYDSIDRQSRCDDHADVALHIIDAFVTAGATHPSDCEPHFAWASKFLHLGGVEHLTVILSNVAAGLEADAGREINSIG